MPFVDWMWAVEWSLPLGEEFTQAVMSHPAANLSVGPASSRGIDDDTITASLVGVCTRLDRRRLRGTNWNVAAKLNPGALGAFVAIDAADLTDRTVELGSMTAIDASGLVSSMRALAGDTAAQSEVLGAALSGCVAEVPRARLEHAADCIAVGKLIEADRSIRNVADLAVRCASTPRTLQRMFRTFAGVSPLWMIRRYRLIEAADAARRGEPPSWSALAAELGYADQAHLSRDFKAAVGVTPSRYAATVVPLES